MVHMATFTQRFDADHRTLSTVRAALRDWIAVHAGGLPVSGTRSNDIELVVTELAANVIDHSDSPWVDIAVTTAGTGLNVAVAQVGEAPGLPDTTSWSAQTQGDRGHGLRIVGALCDEITIERDGETSVVRCRLLS